MIAIPYLIVHDAPAAIDFYSNAFGATEVVRFPTPDGKVMHAEITIGEAHVSVCRGCGQIMGSRNSGSRN